MPKFFGTTTNAKLTTHAQGISTNVFTKRKTPETRVYDLCFWEGDRDLLKDQTSESCVYVLYYSLLYVTMLNPVVFYVCSWVSGWVEPPILLGVVFPPARPAKAGVKMASIAEEKTGRIRYLMAVGWALVCRAYL
jgi:hypothetical protein